MDKNWSAKAKPNWKGEGEQQIRMENMTSDFLP